MVRVPCSCSCNCNNSSIGKDHGAMALVGSWLERCEEVAKEMDVFSGVLVVVFEVALLSAEAPLHELSRRGWCFMCLIQWSQIKSCKTSAKRFQHTPTAPPQLRSSVVDAALHISYAR